MYGRCAKGATARAAPRMTGREQVGVPDGAARACRDRGRVLGARAKSKEQGARSEGRVAKGKEYKVKTKEQRAWRKGRIASRNRGGMAVDATTETPDRNPSDAARSQC